MRFRLKKEQYASLKYSLFWTSLTFLFVSIPFLGVKKFQHLSDSGFSTSLPINTMLLLALTAVSLISIVQKRNILFTFSLGIMATILFISALSYTNKLISNFTMPWLQFFCWVLVLIGLLSAYKKQSPFFRKCSVISFSILVVVVISLFSVNSGSLGSLQFSTTPYESSNTSIFLLLNRPEFIGDQFV